MSWELIFLDSFLLRWILNNVGELLINFHMWIAALCVSSTLFTLYMMMMKFIWDDTQHHQSVSLRNHRWRCAHRLLCRNNFSHLLVRDRLNWTDFVDIIQLSPWFLLISLVSHLTLHELKLDGRGRGRRNHYDVNINQNSFLETFHNSKYESKWNRLMKLSLYEFLFWQWLSL